MGLSIFHLLAVCEAGVKGFFSSLSIYLAPIPQTRTTPILIRLSIILIQVIRI